MITALTDARAAGEDERRADTDLVTQMPTPALSDGPSGHPAIEPEPEPDIEAAPRPASLPWWARHKLAALFLAVVGFVLVGNLLLTGTRL